MAAVLQPSVTPHAFVVDSSGKILYSGRINDGYAAVGKEKALTTSNDLQDAITAIGAGRAVAHPTTEAVGCLFESWKRPAKDAKITWSRDIAPLVYANCTVCHHEGEVAPFSLMSYQDASKRADMLGAVTESRQMPPWKATDTWGTFHDERRLTTAQIKLFQDWPAAGRTRRRQGRRCPNRRFTKTLGSFGTPDLVVKMAKPYKIPAAGRDLFVYSVIPITIPADSYVVGFEYRPGNRKVVHHMIAFLDASGAAAKLAKDNGDGATYPSFGGPGFTPSGGVGGWAPGATPGFLPDGIGHPIKKGSDIVLEHPLPSRRQTRNGSGAARALLRQKTHPADLHLLPIDQPPDQHLRPATATTSAPRPSPRQWMSPCRASRRTCICWAAK